MRLFLDTNIFMEFVEQRKQFEHVCVIIDAILEGKHLAFISTGCIYTLAYLFERSLKHQNIHLPELTHKLRGYLNEVLDMATIVDLSHAGAKRAIASKFFDDIEDSFQYQCAVENHCDVLLTTNDNDFLRVEEPSIEILTPAQFVEKHIQKS